MTAMAEEQDTFRFIRKLRIMTPEEYQRFLHLKLEQIRQKAGYHWAVWLKTDGSFVGRRQFESDRRDVEAPDRLSVETSILGTGICIRAVERGT